MTRTEGIILNIQNDKRLLDSVVFHVKQLRRTVDRAARAMAMANAGWADDPDDDDYALMHSDDEIQYPGEDRDRAIVELVTHYLGEFRLN
jgi:hypothetical protein